MTDLTEEGGIGVVAAFIEAAVLQPTVYWKNAKAQNLPFSMDPKVLYVFGMLSLCHCCHIQYLLLC